MTGGNKNKKDEIIKKINTIQYEPEDLQKAIDDCNNNNITPYKASLIHNVRSSTIRIHVNEKITSTVRGKPSTFTHAWTKSSRCSAKPSCTWQACREASSGHTPR